MVCITKGVKQEIPSGDSSYDRGNTLIIVAERGKGIYQLKDIFE